MASRWLACVAVGSVLFLTGCPEDGTQCPSDCPSGQTLVDGVCVGVGQLRVGLTWDVPGDVDLYVQTPSGKVVYYGNRGPNAGTDGAQLDRDDLVGTGPENIYWPTDTVPPSGTYHVCVNPLSVSLPVTVTVTVQRPGFTTQTFTHTFSSEPSNSSPCTPSTDTFITSFNPGELPQASSSDACNTPLDAGNMDAGNMDAGNMDAGNMDAGNMGQDCGNGVVEGTEECDSTSLCCVGCMFAPELTSCSDEDACTMGDLCDVAGTCVPGGTTLDCDDSDPTTADACAPVAGCAHLGTSGMTSTTLYGNTVGGTLYVDTCPSDQVMVGVSGATGGSWDQIQVECGTPSLDGTLAITVGPGDTLPLRGANVNTPASAMCPTNEVVVGFGGRAGGLIDQLTLRCAPLLASFAAVYTVGPGTVTAIAPVGGVGGVAFADTDCPAGEIAIGANIRAGGSVDAFGLICAVPSIAGDGP